jgi:flagellar basal body-associated protein FliL
VDEELQIHETSAVVEPKHPGSSWVWILFLILLLLVAVAFVIIYFRLCPALR